MYNFLVVGHESFGGDIVTFAFMYSQMVPIFGLPIASYVCLICIASRPDKTTMQVIKQTYIGDGKQAKRQLIEALTVKFKKKDYDEYNAELNAAHSRYEAHKDIILTKKEFCARVKTLVVNVAIVDGKDAAKQMRAQCKKLYGDRDFETFATLCDEYAQKAEDHKRQLLATSGGEQIALEYDGKSTFDGKLSQRLGWTLLGNLVTFLTLGIAYPFAVCIREKWNKKNTVLDGRRLSFDGNGGQLMGKYILWWLLSVVTLGIYAQWVPIKLLIWKAEHTALSQEQECVP